jgi:hypothetical protein
MLQTLFRTAGAVASCLALVTGTPAHAGNRDVVIRLYDMVTTDARSRAAAMHAASDAIASAGITVTWRDCSRGGAAHPCRTVRNAGDLVVRIVPTNKADAPESTTTQLGFAPIDPSGGATVIATVYYDVVQGAARRTGLGSSELLGRAIAHEVGHLLLRAPGHGHSGLMRPLWTDEELMQNRPGDWTFSEADRRQVQAVARESETADDDSAGADATGR